MQDYHTLSRGSPGASLGRKLRAAAHLLSTDDGAMQLLAEPAL